MTTFEFLMVLVSIIMGIGITTLLRGGINLARASTRVDPIHVLWVINTLMAHVTIWIVRWKAGGAETWSFGTIMVFLLLPILLFASAEWLFPPRGQEVDLTTYFMDNRRVFFLLLALQGVMMSVGPTLFFGGLGSPGLDYGSLVIVPMSAVLAWSEQRRVHWAGAAFPLVIQLVIALTTSVYDLS